MAELLVAGALIADGTGAPARPGSVLVSGDRVEAMLEPGEDEPTDVRRIEDAGRVLAPGFVDAHSHCRGAC